MARRLLRAPLRLKVMAGVLAVTLVALVAFDVAAVTTVRRYLLSQTDNNLQGALTLTLPRLAGFLAAGEVANRPLGPRGPNAVPAQFVRPSKGLRITLALPVDGRPADDPDPHAGERELMAHGFSPS